MEQEFIFADQGQKHKNKFRKNLFPQKFLSLTGFGRHNGRRGE